MIESDRIVIYILLLAITVLIIIRYFHDLYENYKVIINLVSLVFIFVLYMCYLYSSKKSSIIGLSGLSTFMFGVKLLTMICMFVIFCTIIQTLLFGKKFALMSKISNTLGNLFNRSGSGSSSGSGSGISSLLNCDPNLQTLLFPPIFLLGLFSLGLINDFVAIIICLFLFYILYYLYVLIFYSYLLFLPRGKTLVTKPVYINKQKSVGHINYCKNKFNHSFSCWIYVNPHPPSTGVAYSKYCNILSFRKNPSISYNNMKDTLRIRFENNNIFKEIYIDKNHFRVQKWTNIIFNYIDGTLDIFVNGKIIHTDNFLITNLEDTEVFIGQDNGIDGGICNVQYYSHPLNKSEIDDIYNYFKNKTPPI